MQYEIFLISGWKKYVPLLNSYFLVSSIYTQFLFFKYQGKRLLWVIVMAYVMIGKHYGKISFLGNVQNGKGDYRGRLKFHSQ
jgi:hypothetical protein